MRGDRGTSPSAIRTPMCSPACGRPSPTGRNKHVNVVGNEYGAEMHKIEQANPAERRRRGRAMQPIIDRVKTSLGDMRQREMNLFADSTAIVGAAEDMPQSIPDDFRSWLRRVETGAPSLPVQQPQQPRETRPPCSISTTPDSSASSPAPRRSPSPSTRRSPRSSTAGATNIIFLGTGGAAILMQPAAQLLQAKSTFPLSRRQLRSWCSAARAIRREVDRRHPLAVGHHEGKHRGHGILPCARRHDHHPGRPRRVAARRGRRPCLRQLRRGRHLVGVLLSPVPVHRALDHAPPRRVRRLCTLRRRREAPAGGAARPEAAVRSGGGSLRRAHQGTPGTSSPAPDRSGRRPTTTACAYSRRCNGSGRGRSTPPTSSTARWSWSRTASA